MRTDGMLKLRHDQLEALRGLSETSFEDQVCTELQKYWPDRCLEFGEAEVRRIVREGRMSANRLRLTSEYDVLRFVNLKFALGEDFQLHEQYQWIVAQLLDERFDPTSAMDAVCSRVSDMLSEADADAE